MVSGSMCIPFLSKFSRHSLRYWSLCSGYTNLWSRVSPPPSPEGGALAVLAQELLTGKEGEKHLMPEPYLGPPTSSGEILIRYRTPFIVRATMGYFKRLIATV